MTFFSVFVNPSCSSSFVQDHYWKTYGKPIWVTEFACVNGARIPLSVSPDEENI